MKWEFSNNFVIFVIVLHTYMLNHRYMRVTLGHISIIFEILILFNPRGGLTRSTARKKLELNRVKRNDWQNASPLSSLSDRLIVTFIHIIINLQNWATPIVMLLHITIRLLVFDIKICFYCDHFHDNQVCLSGIIVIKEEKVVAVEERKFRKNVGVSLFSWSWENLSYRIQIRHPHNPSQSSKQKTLINSPTPLFQIKVGDQPPTLLNKSRINYR